MVTTFCNRIGLERCLSWNHEYCKLFGVKSEGESEKQWGRKKWERKKWKKVKRKCPEGYLLEWFVVNNLVGKKWIEKTVNYYLWSIFAFIFKFFICWRCNFTRRSTIDITKIVFNWLTSKNLYKRNFLRIKDNLRFLKMILKADVRSTS